METIIILICNISNRQMGKKQTNKLKLIYFYIFGGFYNLGKVIFVYTLM